MANIVGNFPTRRVSKTKCTVLTFYRICKYLTPLLAFACYVFLFVNSSSLMSSVGKNDEKRFSLENEASATSESCAEIESDVELSKMAKLVNAMVVGTSFDMFVYGAEGTSDIVSNSIARSGAWENGYTLKLMSLFPCKSGSLCSDNSVSERQGVLLDVGANIGWYSLVASNLGHEVIAFEPFKSNVDLLCASWRILQDSYKKKFHIHRLGLDHKLRQCELFQVKSVNIGDTHSVCDEKTRERFLKKQYRRLGWMNTTTLDDALLDGTFKMVDGIDVMKIDVEGFEPAVIAGGNRFFQSQYAPRYIFMEMVSKMMGEAIGDGNHGKDYFKSVLLHLVNHGYDLHDYSKKGATELSLKNSTLDHILKLLDEHSVSDD